MSGIGVFFALDDETTEKLRKMRSREKRVDFVTDDIENLYFEEHAEFVLDTDHWWAEINIVLTEGTFKIGEGSHALGLAVFDGKQLGLPDEYILSLKTPDQVTEISAALDKVKKADFRECFF